MVVYLHPWGVALDQPRLLVHSLSKFQHYSHLHKTAARLKALLQDLIWAPAATALQSREFCISLPPQASNDGYSSK